MERVANLMRFITLNPGEKHEVPVKDAYPVSYTHLDVYKRQVPNRE